MIDGPLVIPHVYNDKTFFMAAYEYIQLHQPVRFSGLVPTTEQAAGDFSDLSSNFIAWVPFWWTRVSGYIYHPFGLIYPGSTFNLSTIAESRSGVSQYRI